MISTQGYSRGEERARLASREWLVTNGIGGYASGTVAGAPTRRFHGLLVAALPAPLGRLVTLDHVDERLILPDGESVLLSRYDEDETSREGLASLETFRLEHGLPVWRFDVEGVRIERRLVMPHGQNTVHVSYRLDSSDHGRPVTLLVRPWMNFRPHEAALRGPEGPYSLRACGRRFEVFADDKLPPLRFVPVGRAEVVLDGGQMRDVRFSVERGRGYDWEGRLHSPGFIRFSLGTHDHATLVASTESWETVEALSPRETLEAEHERRDRLMLAVPASLRQGPLAALVLAADQFIISPQTRPADSARAHARGDEARTIIAGYHWFTDWGRDTMIALEGLTLVTGRGVEAGCILRTFAHHCRDGLIPNLFPEGHHNGLYHTADATLWFFHAVDRYVAVTGDEETRRSFMPMFREILQKHVQGTRFGIRVDPRDGLLTQGEAGYQLTWMDAKVGDWVVTPRRGKAVEINALYYNALRLLERWSTEDGDSDTAALCGDLAMRARTSFNARFWSDERGYLLDVVDGEQGDDDSLRPNQLFAISLPHAVLDKERWGSVVRTVERDLLTPVGLRSLSPNDADYKARYDGDLRARDAAYHQGTVWGWLVGPYVDAYLRAFPHDARGAARVLAGLSDHLQEAAVGTISEIFDGEPPYLPRGCVAQAWSVAETLRALSRLEHARSHE